MGKITKKELIKKLRLLDLDDDEETKKDVVCALIGHSNIEYSCIGERSWARCNELLGDTLMGSYENAEAVIVGHDCELCRSNYKALGWRDKFMVDVDPFA